MKVIIELELSEVKKGVETGALLSFIDSVSEKNIVLESEDSTPGVVTSRNDSVNVNAMPLSKSNIDVPVVSIAEPSMEESQVETSFIEYTRDDLAQAAMGLMDKGMQGQLQQLLSMYGVASLPDLPKDKYGEFATSLRKMGAQI